MGLVRLRIFTVLLAALLTLGLPASARASTEGHPDGNLHPSVAFLLFYSSDGNAYRCSGTLVAPTVVLTAGHCTDDVVGKVLVTFDSVIAEQPPPHLPSAADRTQGYTAAELTGAGYYAGTAYTHPDYSGLTDKDSWNDVGVLRLSTAVQGIEPSSLAAVGTLDAIPNGDLSHTVFTAVGYGKELRKPETGPQRPTPMDFPLIRRYVTLEGQKLTPQILQTNGSSTDGKGTGTTCGGDSGGPVFLGGSIVAVTSYGINPHCRAVSGYQRVDIAGVQDWLAGFDVPLPAA